MTQPSTPRNGNKRRTKGFERASGLLQGQIRRATETRGFAESRLLTHWAEIVGESVSNMAIPVKISYAQGGFGATLTVLTTGANAPMLQAELPKIKEKVNACYGYAAIARIRITQTAPTGFAEGQVAFKPAPKAEPAAPDPAITATARDVAADVTDDSLRHALEALGQNVLSRPKR
ncbi:MAG: DUF721 domain-containing protein [Paracoccaceae bacterium]